MSLIKKNYNNHSVQNLRNDFDSLFNSFFTEWPLGLSDQALTGQSFTPKINLAEDEKSYHLEAELPGIQKEDIKIDYSQDTLTIKAQKKNISKSKDKDYHRIESVYGTYSRSVQIPNIEVKDVQAEFIDGVLKLNLPKKAANEIKNQITIK